MKQGGRRKRKRTTLQQSKLSLYLTVINTYNCGLLRLKVYLYQYIIFVLECHLILYQPLFNSLGPNSVTHSLQIYCIGLIKPRSHILWVWATNRDYTYIYIYIYIYIYNSNKQSHPSPIAACCKELHQVEDLTSQPGTIGTNLASRPSTALLLYLSLFESLSVCIFKQNKITVQYCRGLVATLQFQCKLT